MPPHGINTAPGKSTTTNRRGCSESFESSVAIGDEMRALFADISERERQHQRNRNAYRNDERRQVLALFDAIQIAVAGGEADRATMLLRDIRAIVDASLVRRRRWRT